jgi:sterol desaturase/sphingolipid hydroxylase (fatty acid hydroxylase superfamily)
MQQVDFTADTAPIIGLVILAAGFAIFAGLERALPFRRAIQPRARRWFTNIALFAIDTLALRLLLPLAMVGTALLAEQRGWGLFNTISAPGWLAFAITLLALDLALYVQHWATHRIGWLWRLHRVHHTDRDFDVTTAARFHPLEIVLSMGWKMAVVAALGAPVLAVAVFETGFALLTLWTHSNLSLPTGVERVVRAAIVTPDMHRIHHSVRKAETNSNYGTALSGWDHLFGTYCAKARDPQASMAIGLEQWQDDRPARLGFSLLLPFRNG